MNILANYRYQMADHKRSILIYYLVIVCLFLILGISAASFVFQDSENMQMQGSIGGIEMATLIFLFVVGLCTFKETFLMSLQNGVSRKTVFYSKLLTMASVAAIMALVDKIIYLISSTFIQMGNGHIQGQIQSFTFYESLYPERMAAASPFQLQVESFFFEFLLALAFMAFGYFISIMFYRLNKTGKVIVGAGVPFLLFMAIPALDFLLFNGALTRAINQLMYFATCSASHIIISAILAFAFFSALSLVLMRKAVIKR